MVNLQDTDSVHEKSFTNERELQTVDLQPFNEHESKDNDVHYLSPTPEMRLVYANLKTSCIYVARSKLFGRITYPLLNASLLLCTYCQPE